MQAIAVRFVAGRLTVSRFAIIGAVLTPKNFFNLFVVFLQSRWPA
jgi:hypothetical protein